MKAILKMTNMRAMESFKIHMGLFIRENGNNHYLMGKDMKSVINSNIKALINRDIVKDMEK